MKLTHCACSGHVTHAPTCERTTLFVSGGSLLFLLAFSPLSLSQPTKPKSPQAPLVVAAEALGKEFVKNGTKAEKKYQGKWLKVTGTVEMAMAELVYLKTGVRYKEGQEVSVILRFKEADIPKVKVMQKVTVEGLFDREAVLGPSLKECRLIKPQK
jgi:hypothetical protein